MLSKALEDVSSENLGETEGMATTCLAAQGLRVDPRCPVEERTAKAYNDGRFLIRTQEIRIQSTSVSSTVNAVVLFATNLQLISTA